MFLSARPLEFLNADAVAANARVDSMEAARILDATRAQRIKEGRGFITETVFSDPYGHKLDMLRAAVEAGFDVTLIYVGLTSARLSALRVDQRVARGGHDVPRDRITSRYTRSLANLKQAIAFVSTVKLYDNSSADEPFQHIATFHDGALTFRMKGRLPMWTRGIVPSARGKR